jgi:hypothetical protein
MAGKTFKQVPTAPLQVYTAVPITDPAEIAELEAKLKRYKDAERPVRTRGTSPMSNKTTTAEVLELARQLSAEKRLQLITQLATQFSPEERLELLERLAGQLRRDAQQQLGKQTRD